MRNVTVTVDEKKAEIVIRCSLKEQGKPSQSGKTRVIASTEGNKSIEGKGAPEGLKLGLNLYVPA